MFSYSDWSIYLYMLFLSIVHLANSKTLSLSEFLPYAKNTQIHCILRESPSPPLIQNMFQLGGTLAMIYLARPFIGLESMDALSGNKIS
jgi:hypothetical protein